MHCRLVLWLLGTDLPAKLMESFDIDLALLARYSVFDPITLEVQTSLDEKDDQLESVEADLGINQGWQADLEHGVEATVDVVGDREAEALTMTLRDCPDDINDAEHNCPSHHSIFSKSTEAPYSQGEGSQQHCPHQ